MVHAMNYAGLLLILAVACGAVAAATAVLIARSLERRGIKTPLPFIGALIFRNLSRYRELTRGETGKTGTLFYSYVVPINLALLLALAALAVHAIGI
ncbi:MAG: hypothetical protein ACYSX0_07220 [Planctomycetota bacterium]